MATFDIDNPNWSAVTNLLKRLQTVPLDRLYKKR